jgi:hypothetical protein
MLVYCWLKRSIPGLLLLVVIACSGGFLKPLLVSPSTSRRGSKSLASSTAEPLATAAAPAHSTSFTNRSEQIAGHRAGGGKVDDWVRTRTGWEHEAKWFATVGRYEPSLHPAVVAALVGLMAVWALVAFPADAAADQRDTPSTLES